jgi:hypothetical protein
MKIEVKTLPEAKVSVLIMLPGTGTVVTTLADRNDKPADASGKVVWEWTITDRARVGEGTMEFTAVLGDQTVKKTVKYTTI